MVSDSQSYISKYAVGFCLSSMTQSGGLWACTIIMMWSPLIEFKSTSFSQWAFVCSTLWKTNIHNFDVTFMLFGYARSKPRSNSSRTQNAINPFPLDCGPCNSHWSLSRVHLWHYCQEREFTLLSPINRFYQRGCAVLAEYQYSSSR